MAVITDVNQIIGAPSPQRLRYGLFSAATVTEDLGPREISTGFQFAAADCGEARLYDSSCAPGDSDAKIFDEGLPYMEADPYWVYSTRQCGTVGHTPAEFMGTVRSRLLGAEQTQVEAALWGGTAPAVDPNLTGNAGTVTVIPSAPGAGAAIAALEESFYSAYGYVGTLHMNTSGYAAAAYSNLVERGTGGVLITPLGSVWSFGAGYNTTGPAGVAAAAGFVWAFMTPYVWIRRSGIIAQDDPRAFLDRALNQYMGLAERVYAHTWTCPVVHAVQVPIAAPATADAPAVPL
jgi:hypothetical protein